MKYSYIIIDDDPESILKTQAVVSRFQSLTFLASATNYDDGLNLILAHNPTLVFLEIDPTDKTSNLSFQIINELYRYLSVIPKIIITTNSTAFAYEAMKYEVLDYFIKPLEINSLRKTILKFEKITSVLQSKEIQCIDASSQMPLGSFSTTSPSVVPETIKEEVINEIKVVNPQIIVTAIEPEEILTESIVENKEIIDSEEDETVEKPTVSFGTPSKTEDKPLIICVKSYGDYRFIEAKDICYLQADNNSTDIHLYNGEMITAFKTLKHFEGVLQSPFVRIHNSYIVNIDYVSRIHTGNAVCYIKNTTTKLPFSKSYKENVDSIINSITNGNYLEI
jgi:DNA-binding LytR/AlgR family response regulator